MCDDEWVKLAIADDSTVAGLLLRLHHPPLNLQWTVRQPRSTYKTSRASPTTPLSWTGAATSASGEEESSRLTKPAAGASRSKVANPSETITTKKPRRKKTLTALKEEESLLLKERRNLKNELASLRLTVEQQISTNESLKKMKLDLESRQNSNAFTTSEVSGKVICGPSQLVEAECHPSSSIYPKTVTHDVLDENSLVFAANASSKAQRIGNQESAFMLPDLNLPVEEDFSNNDMH